MKKILVATDFSEYADYAVKSAASLAKKIGAKLILLHVINRPLSSEDDSYEGYHNMPGGKVVVNTIQDKLKALVNKYEIKEVDIVYELRYDVFKTILKYAVRHKVILIVMGAFGNSGSKSLFIGSNTERVMLKADVPVLIIKEEFKESNIENIVFASAFYGPVYKVFPKMKNIMDLFQSNIHLLKVNTPNKFERTNDSIKLMTEFCKKFGLKKCTKNIYNDLSIEDGIMNYTQAIDADLIAITPDGFWRLAHIFNKNITTELMKKSVRVVLSMRTE